MQFNTVLQGGVVTPEDAKPFARGINSIQLVKAQGRWWIASLIWEDEREGLALPEKYLKP